jgi:hypothetical protein
VEHAGGRDALPIHVVKVKLTIVSKNNCLELKFRVQTLYLMHLQPGAVVYIFTKHTVNSK